MNFPHPAPLRTIVACCALALPGAAQFSAYHNASTATHQSRFTSLSKAGYRMSSLSVYGSASSPLYAAVWLKRSGPAWVGFHGKTSTDFIKMLSQYGILGYRPTLLAASGSGSSIRFAGVFEKSSTPSFTRYNITEARLKVEMKDAYGKGYIPITATVYGTSSYPLYTISFARNDNVAGWGYCLGTPSSHQGLHNAMTQGYSRPELVTSNGSRVLSIWRDDSVGGYYAYHNLSSATYQSVFNSRTRAGYYPKYVTAAGSGSGIRIATMFVTRATPMPRKLTITGTYVPALAAFDTYVRDYMRDNGVQAASLAVVKDARLVLARGYTWAHTGYPITPADQHVPDRECV